MCISTWIVTGSEGWNPQSTPQRVRGQRVLSSPKISENNCILGWGYAANPLGPVPYPPDWGARTLDITILPLNSSAAKCERYTPLRIEAAAEFQRCAAASGKYIPLPTPVPLVSFTTSLEPSAAGRRQRRNPEAVRTLNPKTQKP